MNKCKPYIVTILLFFSYALAAQIPAWEWIRSPGGPAISRCISINSTGDIFIGGGYYNTLIFDPTITLANAGFGEMFIARYNEYGQVSWAKKATGNYGDEARCIINGTSGYIYTAGEFFSNDITFNSYTLINNHITPYFDDATKDIFLVKYNQNGQAIWAASGGGINMEFVRDIAIDTNENVTIIGTFWSTSVTFGPYVLNNTGNIDVFIVQYDSSGQVLWAKNPTGNDEENAYSIEADESGNIYVAGSFRSDSIKFDDITLRCSSEWFDTYVVKYDPFGNAIWAENAAGNDWDEAKSITLDESGNMYLSGHFNSDSLRFGSVVLPKSSTNNIDMFIVKYDSEHQVVWARNSGGNAWAWVYPSDMTIDPLNNIWITGDFIGDSLQFNPISIADNGSYDIYMVKYDENGNVLWADVIGGDGMDWGQAIAHDYAGHVVISGFFESSSITFADSSLSNPTSQNKIYVAKKDIQTTSVNPLKQELDTFDFKLINYPNPFNPSTNIKFEIPNGQNVKMEVFNILGEKIELLLNKYMEAGSHIVKFSNVQLPSGVYFYRIDAGEYNQVKKMIILR